MAAALQILLATFAHAQTCPNPATTPSQPPDGATNVATTVTFQWSAVPGALGYEVWARADSTSAFDEVGGTSDTNLSEDFDPDSTIEWYVVTEFNDCNTESAHFHFQTASCGASVATPISPANGTQNASSPVTFVWQAATGASSYRVWVSKDGADFDVLDETDDTSLTWNLPPGNYEWFIESFFDLCESTDSASSLFTIQRNGNCPTTAPGLVSPAAGSTVQPPVHFAWTAVPGAIGYEVWAALDDGDFDWVGDSATTSLDADLGFGHVTWYVIAQFSGCDDVQSDNFEFDIPYNADCDHNSTLLVSPADGDTNVSTTTTFLWTPVEGANAYNVWITYGNGQPQLAGTSTVGRLVAQLQPNQNVSWYVETTYVSCPSDLSPSNSFGTAAVSNICGTPIAPDVAIDSEVMSGDNYSLIWNPGSDTAAYEVQESPDPSFANPQKYTTTEVLLTLSKTVAVPTRLYYRIRSTSNCSAAVGPFSSVVSVVILPTSTTSDDAQAAASYGTQQPVVQKIHIAGSGGTVSGKTRFAAGTTFNASPDKPWLTVTPSSGTIPPEGLDLTVTADPTKLPVGTSSGTIHLTTTAADVSAAVPVSVNLVTPVTPNAGNTPLPNSLIIPAVAHVAGVGTDFQSDIRIANASAQTMKYQLNFTPTASDGTKIGQQSTIQIDPGETAALNDILKNFYGYAASSDQVAGVLEIRPMTNNGSSASQPNVTFASSRTFATGPNGTYGQYVPAIPFSQFIGKSKDPAKTNILSLQQIAQSAAYRTNVGLVEAAGEPATVQLDVFDSAGTKLGTYSVNLLPGEHKQLNGFLAANGLTNVTDGRIEVSVTTTTGKVTAYASVLDNITNDPMLVLPVNPAAINATRYILPGVADLNTNASWRSDVRIFNAGKSDAPVTISYYPQGNPGGVVAKQVTIPAGQVSVINSALQTLFGITNSGGSFVVTTPAASQIVATARTYNDTGKGTYGQFIPGVTAADGVALGGRALQVLQVEQSDRFRTNIGIVELTGNPVTVEIAATSPDAKVAAKTQIQLQGNEFRQIGDIFSPSKLNFALPTYNARITLKVVGGSGRITGYGSLIDNRTQDPTYVPAQ